MAVVVAMAVVAADGVSRRPMRMLVHYPLLFSSLVYLRNACVLTNDLQLSVHDAFLSRSEHGSSYIHRLVC